METFQGLFESQEKIGEHIKALVELSTTNETVSDNKIAYIQNLAVAYGVDPKTINFNNSENDKLQVLNSFTEYKSKMCLLQDLISICYIDGKFSSSEQDFVVSIAEKLGISSQKINKLLELNAEYLNISKSLGDLIMLEEAN